jgi:Ig-like domain CHU_C associated/Domain of unknown function (DUF6383)
MKKQNVLLFFLMVCTFSFTLQAIAPINTVSPASSSPSVTVNSALSPIIHSTTGATGIMNDGMSGINGLPPGVSAHWNSNTITISGTPTAIGRYLYSILLIGGNGIVYATGTITVIPTAPTGSSNQSFCNSNNPIITDLVATGSDIKWYISSTGGSQQSPINSLISGITYYASQTISGYESTDRLAVTVTISSQQAPIAPSPQSFCAISNPKVSDLIVFGTAIQWYDAPTGGNLIAGGTALVDGTHYYASQTIAGCESSSRENVLVNVNNPAAPTGASPQSFCQISNPKVSNLVVTGTAIKWYDAPTGGNLIAGGSALSDGTTYYASQTIAGCESSNRLAVTAVISPTVTASVSILADQNIVCPGTTVTFTATPTNGGIAPDYQWKVNGISVGTNSATYSYIPINGDVVQVEMTSNSAPCISGNPVSSNAVVLTVNPCAPTGVDDQTIKNDNKNLTELYVSNQLLHIKNAPIGEQVRVISALGIVIYSGVITTDELTVSLPQHGVYIVTVSGKSQSVVY